MHERFDDALGGIPEWIPLDNANPGGGDFGAPGSDLRATVPESVGADDDISDEEVAAELLSGGETVPENLDPDDVLEDPVKGDVPEAQPDTADTTENVEATSSPETAALEGDTPEHVGSAALTGAETERPDTNEHQDEHEPEQPESAPPDNALLDDMRGNYRSGAIRVEGKVPLRHNAEKSGTAALPEMMDAVDEWLGQQATDDPMAAAVAVKFKTAWYKSYGKSDSPPSIEETRAALAQMHDNAVHAHSLGINKANAPAVAQFNSREEIDRAYALAEEHGIPTHVVSRVHGSKTDIVGGVQKILDNVAAIDAALESGDLEGTHIEEYIKHSFAYRSSTAEECVENIAQFEATVAELSEAFPDREAVPLGRIKQMCLTTASPHDALGAKLQLSEDLEEEFGIYGFSEANINHAAFKYKDPRSKLQECIDRTDEVSRALGNRFDETTVRNLILHNKDPIGAGQEIITQIDSLKAAFASNPHRHMLRDSHYRWLLRFGDEAIDKATSLAENLATAKDHFGLNPRITEGMFNHAAAQDGDVIDSINGMLGRLSELHGRYRNQRLPAAVYQKAILADDPDTYIVDFTKMRLEAFDKYSGTFPLDHIHRTVALSAHPLAKLAKQTKIIALAKEQYGHLATVPDATVGSYMTQEGNSYRAAARAYGSAILDTMRVLSSDDSRRGSGQRQRGVIRDSDFRSFIASARTTLESELPASVNVNSAVARLGVIYTNYREQVGDLSPQPHLVDAVCKQYVTDVRQLDKYGIPSPGLVATTTNVRELIRVVGSHKDAAGVIRRIAAKHATRDIMHAYQDYKQLFPKLVQTYKDILPASTIKEVVIESNDPAATLQAYVSRAQALPAQFAHRPEVTPAVINRARSHYSPDPSQYVTHYLERYDAVTAAVPYGPDMDQQTAARLSAQPAKLSDIPGIVAAYQDRLQTVREQVAAERLQIPEKVLRHVASGRQVGSRTLLESAIRSYRVMSGQVRKSPHDFKRWLRNNR